MLKMRQKAAYLTQLPRKAIQQVAEAIDLGKDVLIRTAIMLLTLAMLALIGAFMYGTFYFTFVPSPQHQSSVYFGFQPCDESPGKCGFLNGSVHLSDDGQVLMAGQPYTMELILELPESPTNRDAGMFMTCTQIKSRAANIRQQCRPSMLQYRSDLLRVIDTFVFLPGLLTGHMAQKQILQIEFFDDFYDDPLQPALNLDVQILSRFIEVYRAWFRIHANFQGLRYLMFHYPITSALVGSTFNFMLLTLLFILSWYHFFIREEHEYSQAQAEFSDKPFIDPFDKPKLQDEPESSLEPSVVLKEDAIEELKKEPE